MIAFNGPLTVYPKQPSISRSIATVLTVLGLVFLLFIYGLVSFIEWTSTSHGRFLIRTSDGLEIHAVTVITLSETSVGYRDAAGKNGRVYGNFTVEEE